MEVKDPTGFTSWLSQNSTKQLFNLRSILEPRKHKEAEGGCGGGSGPTKGGAKHVK